MLNVRRRGRRSRALLPDLRCSSRSPPSSAAAAHPVDFLYRLIGQSGRALSTIVDVGRVVFFVTAVGLTVQMMLRMGNLKMTIVELPMNLVYGICALGFGGGDPLGPGGD
jgi:hypothetical protein